ncbi:MAG: chorismate--pyruvate lyase [Lachnospiraceae bacterium]|nr:chorismate--pyruvate lyase [Lachnospiraceae bacterium]
MDFTTRFYVTVRIDGDYAYLLEETEDGLPVDGAEEKCVARALLPAELAEGSRVKYEMMSYEMIS